MTNDIMTFEEAIESLTLKFTSGNDIEVERATILRKEWKAILTELERIKIETIPIGI